MTESSASFPPNVLAWFDEGEHLAERPEPAGYEPLRDGSAVRHLAAVVGSVAAAFAAVWLLATI